MRILAIDMGTGTQDILLFDSRAPVESNVKMVMPSATEIAARRIRRATYESRPVLLSGVRMGAGPCRWALEAHLASGVVDIILLDLGLPDAQGLGALRRARGSWKMFRVDE